MPDQYSYQRDCDDIDEVMEEKRKPHIFVDDVNPMKDTFGSESVQIASQEVEE